MSFRIHHGDALTVLRSMPDASFDACLTDPPYGLAFMGKKWDHGVPSADMWAEVLRVLKPGGMILAFGGTRTFHRLTCAIEDAGFEIRDCLMWIYGSGFPKSMDISKAIDKRRATNDVIRPWLRSLGTREEVATAANVTPRQVDHWMGDNNTPCPQTLTEKRFVMLCEHFQNIPDWADEMFANVGAKVGTVIHSRSGGTDYAKRPGSQAQQREVDVTAPATPEAQRWSGFGSALKPAWEPIILAMKPLDGTFANNALKHGVAGLAIDAGRIAADNGRPCRVKLGGASIGIYGDGLNNSRAVEDTTLGRWPANLILDEDSARLLDEASGETKSSAGLRGLAGRHDPGQGREHNRIKNHSNGIRGHEDSGGASRFFYISKADSSERHASGKNNHPTVKPIDLAAYLAKLILPPERDTPRRLIVPFSGSGSEIIGALRAGWDHVEGIEQDAGYAEFSRIRIEGDAPLLNDEATA